MRHNNAIILLLLCLGLVAGLLSSSVSASDRFANKLQLQPGTNSEPLPPFVFYREDADASLDAERIVSNASLLTPLSQSRSPHNIDFGLSRSVFWLVIPIKNATDQYAQWMVDPNVRTNRRFQVIKYNNSGFQQLYDETQSTPFTERMYKHRMMVAPLELAPQEEALLIIAYQTDNDPLLQLEIVTPETFEARQETRLYRTLVFCGFVSALILVNLGQYLLTRRISHFHYIMLQVSALALVLQLEGFFFQMLWPQLPEWDKAATSLFGVTLVFFLVLFCQSFLMLKQLAPRLNLLANLILCVYLVLFIGTIIDLYSSNKAIMLVNPLAGLFCLVSAVVIVRQGVNAAFYYLCGILCLIIGSLYVSFAVLSEQISGIISTPEVWKLTLILEASFMAFALARQVRQVYDDNEKNQQLLIQSLYEREEDSCPCSRTVPACDHYPRASGREPRSR